MQTALKTKTEKVIEYQISHVPERYRPYPGEALTFFTAFKLNRITEGLELNIFMPAGLRFLDYECDTPQVFSDFSLRDLPEGFQLNWKISDQIKTGEQVEVRVKVRILPAAFESYLISEAEVIEKNGTPLCTENTRVLVRLQSELMRYLPEIFQQDEFLGRFLMLFESFWKPIENQIRQGSLYYSPGLTPEEFLPWLGTWVGIYWDEFLPAERQRLLLLKAVTLFQKRGTKSSLEEYLRIYTDGDLEIIEHRANNLALGKNTRLGNWVALGKSNYPHTFTVKLKIRRDKFDYPSDKDPKKIEEYLKKNLEALIKAQKPAHTAYTLQLSFEDPLKTE